MAVAIATYINRVSFQEFIVLKKINLRKNLVCNNIVAINYIPVMLLLLLDEGGDLGALHNLDFAMIKYPRKRKHSSLPHERVFTMDYDNQVMSKIIIYL